MSMLNLIRSSETDLLKFSHYFAFSAVVMLYVYAIQQRHAPPETYLPAFHAATKCQAQITSIAIPGSLGQRYGVVLQELRVELLRHNTNLLDLGSTNGQGAGSGSASIRNGEEGLLGSYTNQDILDLGPQSIGFAPASEDITGQLGLTGQDGLGFSEHSPGSSIVQMTGWGQFESLVRTISRFITTRVTDAFFCRSREVLAVSRLSWMVTWERGTWGWASNWIPKALWFIGGLILKTHSVEKFTVCQDQS